MNKNDTGVMDPVKLEIASNGNYFITPVPIKQFGL